MNNPKNKGLTHFNEHGDATMVDVGAKSITQREARGFGVIKMKPETLDTIIKGESKKGDVLGVARLAGIMAAKKTPDLIPLAHPLPLDSVTMSFNPKVDQSCIEVVATARVTARTGVEMEALTAVGVACLTIYDMCKSIDRSMVISQICLLEKSGGASGHYKRDPHELYEK